MTAASLYGQDMSRWLMYALGAVVLVIGTLTVVFAARTPVQVSTESNASTAGVPTGFLDPSSVCAGSYDFLTQSTNGDVTGCFRIPNLHRSVLVVALQTFVDQGGVSHSSPTTVVSSVPSGRVSLSVSSAQVTPGEHVSVTGHYATAPPQPRTILANLCWGGCRTGLSESVQLHWVSSFEFRATLKVPDTAWLVSTGGSVSIHPLQSGTYEVGIQCLGEVSGCALGPADAKTQVQLRVTGTHRCANAQPCASLRLSSVAHAVGDEVRVTGWAPLQSIIAQPSGWDLSVAPAGRMRSWPSLTSTPGPKSGGYNVVLAPTLLHLTASPTWASLGRLRLLSSTWAGPSVSDAQPGTSRIGWCLATGLTITDGSSRYRVPTADVARALRGTVFRALTTSASMAQCAGVLLDPRRASSIFGEFEAAIGGSIPPVYMAGLYSTNGGTVWRTVPTPPGERIQDFAGFLAQGPRVEALFADDNSYSNRVAPSGTTHGLVPTEVTVDGGVTWTASTLGCPQSGPCVTVGPFQLGHCAMNPSPQSLLVGPAGATADAGVRWSYSSFVTTLNSCASPELVATSPHDLVLLDASSQYPLVRSTDSGAEWTNVSLPAFPVNYGLDSIPSSNSLVLGANGALLESVTTPSGIGQQLWRLDPGATSWCQVPGVFGSPAAYRSIGPLRSSGSALMWAQVNFPANVPETSSTHVAQLSALRC